MLPVAALRPFDEQLTASSVVTAPSSLTRSWRRQIEELLMDVPIEAVAVLGSHEIPLRDLLALDVGSVIRLDSNPESPVDVSINGLVQFRGTPLSHHGNVAIKITDVRNKE
jgi:flagellar motor switch protein FliM